MPLRNRHVLIEVWWLEMPDGCAWIITWETFYLFIYMIWTLRFSIQRSSLFIHASWKCSVHLKLDTHAIKLSVASTNSMWQVYYRFKLFWREHDHCSVITTSDSFREVDMENVSKIISQSHHFWVCSLWNIGMCAALCTISCSLSCQQ